MRIARFRHEDSIRTGIVTGDEITEAAGEELDVVAAGPELETGASYRLDEVELLAPIARPPTSPATGLNYRDHMAESGQPAPEFPVFFNKQSTCVIGPGEAIHRPRVSEMLDYEGELGIVIGRRCRHVAAGRAHEVVAGYTIVN